MTKIRFFFGIETAEELKKEFKKLALKLHPDNGGDAEEFKAMQAEFSKLWDNLKNIHTNKKGEQYDTTGTDRATTETAAEFMNIIEKLMFIADISVELCGSWIWVSGNTKEHRDLLKELGFKYSSNKQMWYYQRDGVRKFHKKAWTIDEIRNAYGSKTYKGERESVDERKLIEA